MSFSKFIPAAFAAALLVSGAAMAQDQSAPQSATEQGEHHEGPFHMLSPEQKMMLFVQMRDETANMSDDQKHDYRHAQRDKFMAMSDSERQQFAQNLQAKWDALSPDKQADIRSQMQAWRQQRHAEHEQMEQQQGNQAPPQQ
jgi:hypothetical protein